MKIEIEKPAGLWTINGKRYSECNYFEKNYFNLFLSSHKNQKQAYEEPSI